MKNSKVLASLLAVFVSGLVIGAASGTFYMKSKMAKFFERPPKPPVAFIVQRLSQDLGLSEEQRRAAETIVAESSEKMEEEFAALKPRLDANLDAMAAKLKEHLAPEQQKRLDAIILRIKSREPPPFDGPGGPGGPGGPPLFGGPPEPRQEPPPVP